MINCPPDKSRHNMHITRRLIPLFATAISLFIVPITHGAGPTAVVLQTFSVTETFGITHPDQIIDFDYPVTGLDPNTICLLGPDGVTQVPFQVLSSNRIAVRTSLPAYATKNWQLMSGCVPNAPSYADQVTMDTSIPDYYRLSNGLTGVRVFRSHGGTRAVPIASVAVSGNIARLQQRKTMIWRR